jgi:hypothetical protein
VNENIIYYWYILRSTSQDMIWFPSFQWSRILGLGLWCLEL